jgi:hypothetical protein
VGCACGKNRALGYIVNKPDGTKSKVRTLQEAITVARRVGGTYQRATR